MTALYTCRWYKQEGDLAIVMLGDNTIETDDMLASWSPNKLVAFGPVETREQEKVKKYRYWLTTGTKSLHVNPLRLLMSFYRPFARSPL